jgi:hypothetical protein
VDALLAKESTEAELESFRLESGRMVDANISASMFIMSDDGPVATFYFGANYSPDDRARVETWLRQHFLVRRITFENV